MNKGGKPADETFLRPLCAFSSELVLILQHLLFTLP